MRIAVIGGGIAGLTTALAFAKQGASVCVFEQAPALTEVGAGLQITPNGARPLAQLGVWETLHARGVQAQAVVPTDALTGKAITRFDLSRFDPSYLFVRRADLIDVLATAAQQAGANITLNARTETMPDGFDLVVGAEGIRSSTRAAISGPGKPFFTGQVAWRAIVPGHAAPEARIWMGPGCHVVSYPLGPDRINLVAVEERAEWADEGWHHPDDPANLRDAFAGMCRDLTDLLAKVETVNLWGLFRHPVADTWHNGAAVLVGDAAHPTLPFLAQGANLAIEDAYALAQTCQTQGIDRGLPLYQTQRKPRVTRAIAAANANARNYHLTGLRRYIAHRGLKAMGFAAPGAFLNRMNWLYGHDVTR